MAKRVITSLLNPRFSRYWRAGSAVAASEIVDKTHSDHPSTGRGSAVDGARSGWVRCLLQMALRGCAWRPALRPFHELELVVVHQEVDSIAVRPAAEAVVKLFFTVDGERRGFFVMERTARVKIFALLFQLYPRIDQIDDVGSGKQIANKYAWNSSSHKPRYF